MKTTETKKRLGIEVGSAADSIREAIAATPKMSKQDQRVVARNMDEILVRAKRAGVQLYEVAEHAGLGQRGEKNPKHLHHYRLPVEGSERKLICKARHYVHVIEALAGIPGHLSSGSTDDLMRELFAGSSYGAPRGAGAELKVELKALIDGCVQWMDRHLGLAETYALLERMQKIESVAGSQGRVAALYDATTSYRSYAFLDASPQMLLGTQYRVFRDALGDEITARDSDGQLGNVCYGRRLYLYAGPNEEGVIRPYLIVVPTLVLRGNTSAAPDRAIDRIIDGAKFGSIELELFGGSALIEPEAVARTVNLVGLEEANPEEGNPVLHAFIDANPDFADQEFSEGEGGWVKQYDIVALTLDALDSLERWLEHADTSKGILAYSENFPASLRYGPSVLARLADRFMQPWVGESLIPEIAKLTKVDQLDWSKPPNGWVHPIHHPHLWSATDIWWLRAKWFKTEIDMAFEAQSRGELTAYQELMSRFQEGEKPDMGPKVNG